MFDLIWFVVAEQTEHEMLESNATSKCLDKEVVAVSLKVCADWQRFVSVLSPSLFSVDNLKVIKGENRDDFFLQSRTALDMWTKQFGDKANRRSMIEALCEIECRSHAEAVFGRDLVEHVCPSS